MAQSNGRWWEFYLVRYLLGTFTGSIIILIFLFKRGIIKTNNYKLCSIDLEFLNLKLTLLNCSDELLSISFLQSTSFLIVIISAGFVFCYLASAPILVLHACRFLFISKKKKHYKTKFAFSVLFISLILFLICFTTYNFHWTNYLIISIVFYILLFLLIIITIKKNHIKKYKKLASKRALGNSENKYTEWIPEYVESYKHLREHGNTFLIIIFEILLAIILFQIKDLTTFTIVIVLWILPAAFIWQFGNFLESKLYID